MVDNKGLVVMGFYHLFHRALALYARKSQGGCDETDNVGMAADAVEQC